MTIPTTPFGILAIMALLLPGVVFAAARTSMQGFLAHDRSIGGRIIQALMISIILDTFYLAILGVWLRQYLGLGSRLVVAHPVIVGVMALVLAVIFPALCAYVTYGRADWTQGAQRWLKNVIAPATKHLRPNTQYRSVPTAWDWIAGKQGDKWVRVLNAQGHWVGGWFSQDAYFSVYPEPRDLFIPIQWHMNSDGSFDGPVEQSAGVWVSLDNAQVVEWIDISPQQREDANQ